MLFLRSLLFNAAFYINNAVWMVVLLPSLVLPRRSYMHVVKAWAGANVWLLRAIVGARVEVRGRENIPAGPLLVVSKHQSALETLALVELFDDPAFVLKKELLSVPLFGWYLRKAEQVPVDRSGDAAALKDVLKLARTVGQAGRQLIIFPEGTRRAPGAPPDYKLGVVQIYRALDAPCLPVALNSGLFWPRRGFFKYPGTITIEALPPLPPGLPRADVLPLLVERIEGATERLLAEGRAQLGLPAPVPRDQAGVPDEGPAAAAPRKSA